MVSDGFLIRWGRFQVSGGRCPGQKRPGSMKNGHGRTFWLPGYAVTVRWGEL